jgi:hypothetical protein
MLCDDSVFAGMGLIYAETGTRALKRSFLEGGKLNAMSPLMLIVSA